MIDKFTFGNSPAALDLTQIIIENGFTYKKTRKLTHILNNFHRMITLTNHMELEVSMYLVRLVYEDSKAKCEVLDEKIRSHALTVLTTAYREWQRRKKVNQSKKKRNVIKQNTLGNSE